MPRHNLNNLMTNIPEQLPQELFTTLCESGPLKIERIVSQGHASPQGFWYDQKENEWVVLISGEARLEFADGQEHHLKAGDYINIPAHQKHRVNWTSTDQQTVWLAVFYAASNEQKMNYEEQFK